MAQVREKYYDQGLTCLEDVPSGMNYPVSYWRTASQIEIDFVLGEHEVAIEVKASQQINHRHLILL